MKRNAILEENIKKTKLENNFPEISKPDTTNLCGHEAYKVDDDLHLIAMLNTLKVEPQYYRNEDDQIVDLFKTIDIVAQHDPYFVAQCIVYSRCVGEGLRTINHIAAAYLSKYIAGHDYAKRFYSLWNKKESKGGCIFRPDDMSRIKEFSSAINGVSLTNPMKKGFANTIEKLDSYSLLKYKKDIIDISNLSHPKSKLSKSISIVDNKEVKTIDAIMQGLKVSADTWEVAQSDAGQQIAKAIKDGSITEEQAKILLKEAKSQNWAELLLENKLGILAALRNIRNILTNLKDQNTLNLLCNLLSNEDEIRKGKIMPYQIDLAYEAIKYGFSDKNSRIVLGALEEGMVRALPNLAEILPGRNLVVLDVSGSMTQGLDGIYNSKKTSSCIEKGSLITAMIAKACNADIIRFSDYAEYVNYNPNSSLFDLKDSVAGDVHGATNLASVFNLIKDKEYDRIFIISDNECNHYRQSCAYEKYTKKYNPYIYSIDLCSYGSMMLQQEGRVNYYYGYGYSMFDDISSKEFNPEHHIEKVKKIII